VQLLGEKQVATMHFPEGMYSLCGSDDTGFYYRAPRPVVQHNAGSSIARNGGIYLNKRNHEKLGGYVFFAGAITHVGDLSHAPHKLGQ